MWVWDLGYGLGLSMGLGLGWFKVCGLRFGFGLTYGQKLPNQLPNFCLIACLIACLIVPSSLNHNLGFILIRDALRDHPATPEMGTFVPNGRHHGAMAAAGAPAKKCKSN